MSFPIYAVVGIPVIFLLGLLGALTPPTIAFFFPKYGVTQKYYFTFFNGLAAGLILAVGYLHTFPHFIFLSFFLSFFLFLLHDGVTSKKATQPSLFVRVANSILLIFFLFFLFFLFFGVAGSSTRYRTRSSRSVGC